MTKHTPDQAAIDRGSDSARQLLDGGEAGRTPLRPAAERDLLFAIGDSWLNYWPRGDILDVLEDRRGHAIWRAAREGRKLAELLYGTKLSLLGNEPLPAATDGVEIGQLVARIAATTADERSRLLAILVSAGGNDVAGNAEVLKELVNPAGQKDLLNEASVERVVKLRMRELYVVLIACITEACRHVLGRTVPILLHGYDYPVADGRGPLPKHNWLEPVLVERGHVDDERRIEIMQLLIDELNEMQRSLCTVVGFEHVLHVDLRGALDHGSDHTLDWQNELHPSIPRGFGKVTDRFATALDRLTRDATADALAPAATA